MKWKKSVRLINDNVTYISDNSKKIPIIEEDIYIVDSLIGKEQSEEDLVRLVMEKENLDELSANLRMAEFVEKYGQWIDCSEDNNIIPV